METNYPNPNNLNPQEMLQAAENYLKCTDFGAARFYGNFAVAIGEFDQQLVDAGSILAPNPNDAREYLTRAEQTVSNSLISIQQNLEEIMKSLGIQIIDKNKDALLSEHSSHIIKYKNLKEQFGKEYIFLV